MSVSIFSYAGHVTVGFLVNRRLAGDPQALADGVRGASWRRWRTATSAGRSAVAR